MPTEYTGMADRNGNVISDKPTDMNGEPTADDGAWFTVETLAAADHHAGGACQMPRYPLDECDVSTGHRDYAAAIIQAAKGHDSTLCPDPDCFNGHHPAKEAERE